MVTQKSDIVTRRQGVHVRFKDVEVLGSVQDIPLDDSENFLVSNGPQNLTYASNVARMAGLKVMPSSDENISGGEYDSEVNHFTPMYNTNVSGLPLHLFT
jgi:hypothetical protein